MFGTVTDVLIMKDPVTQVGLPGSITLGLFCPINYGYYSLYEAVRARASTPLRPPAVADDRRSRPPSELRSGDRSTPD